MIQGLERATFHSRLPQPEHTVARGAGHQPR